MNGGQPRHSQVQVPEGAAVPELVKLKMETEAKLAEADMIPTMGDMVVF